MWNSEERFTTVTPLVKKSMNNLQCYQQQKRERKGRQFDKGTSPKQYSPGDKSFKVEVFLVIIDKLS